MRSLAIHHRTALLVAPGLVRLDASASDAPVLLPDRGARDPS